MHDRYFLGGEYVRDGLGSESLWLCLAPKVRPSRSVDTEVRLFTVDKPLHSNGMAGPHAARQLVGLAPRDGTVGSIAPFRGRKTFGDKAVEYLEVNIAIFQDECAALENHEIDGNISLWTIGNLVKGDADASAFFGSLYERNFPR
jgi:hypothetical protein